jgi:hypothetical protein
LVEVFFQITFAYSLSGLSSPFSLKKKFQVLRMKWDYIKRETRFPFRTRIGDHVITVTGLHYSGAAYETDGYGLLPLNIIPLEPIDPAPEMPRFCAESTAIESGRKEDVAQDWLLQNRGNSAWKPRRESQPGAALLGGSSYPAIASAGSLQTWR